MRIIFFCLPDPLHPNWIHTARVRAVERKANISKKNLLFSFDLKKQAVTPRTTISSANLPVRVGTEIMLCSKPQLSASHVLVRGLPRRICFHRRSSAHPIELTQAIHWSDEVQTNERTKWMAWKHGWNKKQIQSSSKIWTRHQYCSMVIGVSKMSLNVSVFEVEIVWINWNRLSLWNTHEQGKPL